MRFLHTMIRVGDLDKSIAFYTDVLGMKLLRRHEYPDGRFTLAFVGFGPDDVAALVATFHEVHERVFAVRDEGSAVEVVNWKALIDHGGYPGVRDKGLLRMEGKDYIVKDGGVLVIRHG